MAKLYFIFFFVLLHSTSIGQINISGKIIDKSTYEPLPYVYVLRKGKESGAITNEDGVFKLTCNIDDTLIIRYVSYYTTEVPCTYFKANSTFYLRPKTNMLNEVTVRGEIDLDPYLDVISTGRRKLLLRKEYDTKVYFTLASHHQERPMELLECYYNSRIYNEGIKSLSLKNGRIGLVETDDTYYVSLHTTDVISNYQLLSKKGNDFPSNPLHYSKRKQKKYYNIKLISAKGDLYKLAFIPKTKFKGLFHAYVWIDKKKENIVKTEIFNAALKMHPLIEIDPQHHLDSLNYNMAYTFSNTSSQTLDKIEFKYNLKYDNRVKNRKIFTEGVFLFYEKNHLFELPFFSQEQIHLSDYDKIVSQPHNAMFWEYNEVLSPSEKTLKRRAFFEKNGVLLNFSELSKHNELFQNRVVSWDTTRYNLTDLNGSYSYNVNPNKSRDYHHIIVPSELYDFIGGIYLDRNVIGDTTFYLTSTQVNLEASYFYLRTNPYTLCFINIAYDLIEIERRQLMATLTQKDWTKNQADSIYYACIERLDLKTKAFVKAVDYGNNALEMDTYIAQVKNQLGVDNGVLKQEEEPDYVGSGVIIIEDPVIEIYNAGSAMVKLGYYSRALEILHQTDELDPEDVEKYPSLFYNMAFCYFNLGDMEMACKYFKKAVELGEKVSDAFMASCHKN